MKVSLKQAQQISELLGFSLRKYTFLAKGNHNINYLLHTDKGKFVLRIENNLQFKNLKKEYLLLLKLKPNLAPKVFFFDNSHKILPTDYLLEEFIAGKHPQKITEDFLISMAQWFKNLHKTTKNTSRAFYLDSALKPYYKNYLRYEHHIKNKELREKLATNLEKAKQVCIKERFLFKNEKKISLLHNDSSRENIFYRKHSIQLIDWEFASYGFPQRELVYFIDAYDLNEKQTKLFLKTYSYPKSSFAQKRLQMYFILHLCSSIGYSLWRLDTLKEIKEKSKTVARLKKDLEKLSKIGNLN